MDLAPFPVIACVAISLDPVRETVNTYYWGYLINRHVSEFCPEAPGAATEPGAPNVSSASVLPGDLPR
jgi:hypothetical protein